jgi:hypothetical protein
MYFNNFHLSNLETAARLTGVSIPLYYFRILMKFMLIISLLLHSLILLNGDFRKPPVEPPPEGKGDSEEKEEEGGIKFTIKKFEEEATIDCPDYYVGIGITISFFRVVIEVAPDSPADKGGLQKGDILLNDPIANVYEEGTEITVDYYRNHVLYSTKVTVAKICSRESK